MGAHVADPEDDPFHPEGLAGGAGAAAVQGVRTRSGGGPADALRAGIGMMPVVGSAGVLVMLVSAASVEGLRRVAQAWTGPVLLVGSPEEAREVIGGDGNDPVEDDAPRSDVQAPVPVATDSAATPEVPVPERPSPGAGALVLDPDRQVVCHRGQEAPLTPLEFRLLSALLSRPGRVRRFEQLTEEVWGTRHVGDAAPVHSVVKRLRRKLEALRAPVQLQAVRGIGFRLAERPALSVVDR